MYIIFKWQKRDFRSFKESQVHVLSGVKVLADSEVLRKFMNMLYRRTKKNPLSREHKKENRDLMSKRVVVENVIGLLKRFKIISDRY